MSGSGRILPSWTREIATLVPVCSHFFLTGNTRDTFLAGESGSESLMYVDLITVVEGALNNCGINHLLVYEYEKPLELLSTLSIEEVSELLGTSLDANRLNDEGLGGLLRLIESVAGADSPVGLLILGASRLANEVHRLSEPEFRFYRSVASVISHAAPVQLDSDPRRYVFNPVVWVLDNERDIPDWLLVNSELTRQVVVPSPDVGEHLEAARLSLSNASPYRELPSSEFDEATQLLVSQASGLSLAALQRIVDLGNHQAEAGDGNGHLSRLENAARSYRVGITDSPWSRGYLRERLLLEVEPPSGHESLKERVIGQDSAVDHALDILIRSVSGLTAAHASPSATKPRGVLFFAGPTGVGKTELAKGLTKLIFGHENQYVRFDMSEFTADHSADRLIGAPPGYIGHDAGGELTNAIREKPFSLVLFDEVEKAHPLILDKFLQILDDGRLTDGRGETVYFTEAVIVFTSNKGIYIDREVVDELGNTRIVRELNVKPPRNDAERLAMTERVEGAIRDYFIWELGRPELLNRIGDNIVVFDFIDREKGREILDLMLENVLSRVAQHHSIEITVAASAKKQLAEACLTDAVLELGGRGIGSQVESVLVNPLARELFMSGERVGGSMIVDSFGREGGAWRVNLKST